MATYEFTYPLVIGGLIVADIDGRCTFSHTPGRPAQLYGPAEDCYPAEDPEVEIEGIELYGHRDGRHSTSPEYRPLDPTDPLHKSILEWLLDKHYDDMCERAEDHDAYLAELAADWRYERDREMQAEAAIGEAA